MIRALMLIVDPAGTWEKIVQSPQRVGRVFTLYLFPLMLLGLAVEAWGLMKLGADRGQLVERRVAVPQDLLLRYEATQLGLGLLLVFAGGWLMKQIGEGFHRRHTYGEGFSTLAYALGPYFLARMLDGVPAVNTWVCWSVGILLTVAVLYRGIPRLMKPDPSNALGVYLMCSLSVAIVAGLAHFLAVMVLNERLFAEGFNFAGGLR